MSGKLLNSISNIDEKRSYIRYIPSGDPNSELIPDIKPDTGFST